MILKQNWDFEFGLYDITMGPVKPLYRCMYANKKVYNSVCHRKNMRLHFEPFYVFSLFSIKKI